MRLMMLTAVLASTLAVAAEPAFTYTYPAQVRAIPALSADLDADRAKLRADYDKGQADDRRDRARTGAPFNPWSASYVWKVVTDLPRFLSLSEETNEYTGGAHGNPGFGALVWDRKAGHRIDPKAFFISQAALDAAVRPAFCAQIAAERRAKEADRNGAPQFAACPDPSGAGTVILGSSTRVRFDRIGFLIAPYAVGPYAEGDYEVTLPVTPAVLAAVKPEWRGYFAPGPSSTGAP